MDQREFYYKYVLIGGEKPQPREVDKVWLDGCYQLCKTRYGSVLRKLAE